MKTSNWPHGTDLGSPSFTGKASRNARGGFKPDSDDIPLIDAILYVGGTAAAVWATYQIALWIIAGTAL